MTTAYNELLHGLFTTAIEGGINYWNTYTNSYHWSLHDEDDLMGFRADIEYVHPETDEMVESVIDRSVIAKGYRMAVSEWRDKVRWSTEAPPVVVTEDSDWDYDAGDADVIVQLALFGRIVFG